MTGLPSRSGPEDTFAGDVEVVAVDEAQHLLSPQAVHVDEMLAIPFAVSAY